MFSILFPERIVPTFKAVKRPQPSFTSAAPSAKESFVDRKLVDGGKTLWFPGGSGGSGNQSLRAAASSEPPLSTNSKVWDRSKTSHALVRHMLPPPPPAPKPYRPKQETTAKRKRRVVFFCVLIYD